MVIFGLAHAATLPNSISHIPDWAAWAAIAGFAVHAIMMLTQSRRFPFIAFTIIQAVLFAIGVTYFIRLSQLSSGG